MRRQVATYLTEEEFRQLTRQAAGRNLSLSRYVKERLLKAESGSGADTEAEAIAEAIVTAERRFADGVERSIARALKPQHHGAFIFREVYVGCAEQNDGSWNVICSSTRRGPSWCALNSS